MKSVDINDYFVAPTDEDVDRQIDETFKALDRGEINFLSKEEANARIAKKRSEIIERLKNKDAIK
jgi:hypothetical protein